jgi:hypothetical protein
MLSGPGGATLAYDPVGRLGQTMGTNARASVTTRFGYDGTELVAEYSATGTLLRRYVHGPADDDPSSGMKAQAPPTAAGSTPTNGAASPGSVTARARALPSTPMMNMVSLHQRTWTGSAISAKLGCRRSASTITRRGYTRPRSGGSCRPTPSDIRMGSTGMIMSRTIR